MQNDQSPFAPSHRFLYKAEDSVEGGGCWLDVYLGNSQGGEPHPIALMIHGGAFFVGDAKAIPYNQVRLLLAEGFVVVSIEYRLLPQSVPS